MADPLLTAEQAAVLSGSFAEYSQYFNKFSREHFPQLNLVMVDVQDPQRSQHIRDALEAIAARPEVQAKLGTPEQSRQTIGDYAEEMIRRIDTHVQLNQVDDPKSKTLAFYQPNFPGGGIMEAGAQIAPIVVNNGACTSCKATHNLMSCEVPDRFSTAKDQMDRLFTGFHEFGHAAADRGKTFIGTMFSDLTSSKNYGNRSESLADSFATLMMIREFGDLGRNYIRLSPQADPSDATHMTQRAVDATLQWVDQNPDRLKSMSPAELLELARGISNKHALTSTEVKATDDYLNRYSLAGGSSREKVEERLAAAAAGNPPAGYGPMAQEMDRYFQRFTGDLRPALQDMYNQLDEIKQCKAPENDGAQIDVSALPRLDEPAETARPKPAPAGMQPR